MSISKEIERQVYNAVKAQLVTLGGNINRLVVKQIDDEKLIAWGKLRNSVMVRTVGSTLSSLCLEVGVYGSVEGKQGAYYGQFLHEGIKPHMPPIQPLIEWAKKKLRLSGRLREVRIKYRKDGSISYNNKDIDTQKRATALAWIAARKIKREGREPSPFIRMAVQIALAQWK